MSSRRPGFQRALERRARWVDLTVLALPVVVNVGVFFLPHATKARLALNYEHPTLLSIFASSYVHFALEHLVGNLLAYAVGAGLVYLLCVHSRRRGLFYALTVTSLLAFPFVLGALNVALVRPRVGYGFSGVVLSYFGFLPTALYAYVHRHFADDVGIRHSPLPQIASHVTRDGDAIGHRTSATPPNSLE
ncbi:hypothetical protein [Halarchaeum acidiphilum]|uniref:hypothetical protein n=1 Tax=Halarchaeum acidiphilum TaxID=489138 RepID=UPI000379997A|nr:hypothetical protein [Halarchaeum acidiphilum]